MQNPFGVYQKNQVMTVSGEKLLLMLCDGLVRFIRNAITASEKEDIQEINTNLLKAQGIVAEMMASLDTGSGEFAQNLFQIYEFLYKGLIEANVKKDAHLMQEMLSLAVSVQNTWSEAAKAVNSDRTQQKFAY